MGQRDQRKQLARNLVDDHVRRIFFAAAAGLECGCGNADRSGRDNQQDE